ncbi:MAG: fructose bisphosphate aldolase [Nocardioides sp.]
MNLDQAERLTHGTGFFAALDQSGGSTPKALAEYGVPESAYHDEAEMFDLVHQMRTRVITDPAFSSEHVLAAILFEQTMRRDMQGRQTAEFLWEDKRVVPILKVDRGLADEADGVQLMKDVPDLDQLLADAVDHGIVGTKMRSVIKHADPAGITAIVDQQFVFGERILRYGLVPILEPEVDIAAADKEKSEELLKARILDRLDALAGDEQVLLKISIPTADDFWSDVMTHPRMMRVVALSGGYERAEAVERLARNHGLIASFSRALLEGLLADQPDEEFSATLATSIQEIAAASAT